MSKLKKLLTYMLAFSLIISTFYVCNSQTVKAGDTFLIKLENSDTYLYANGSKVVAGSLKEGDTGYYWIIIRKDDGTYWLQNQSTGGYMCIQNQTGKVELINTIYDVWDSSKWRLNIDTSTTIQSKWLGAQGYVYVSGADVLYGRTSQKYTFESVSVGDGNQPTEPFVTGGRADKVTIPATNSNINTIGATMPYTRYDSKAAILGGGAILAVSNDFAKNNIASQASEQSYVRLPRSGSYAEWTMNTTGNGVTMRFTLPDSANGMGQNGSLDVYVNGNKVQTVNLTSYYMWQYFPKGSPADTPGGTACFAFDETHFRLSSSLKKGDKIRIQSSGANGLEYGVDFLEIEETGAEISKPENAVSVTEYGATPNDDSDDYYAIRNCIVRANAEKKDVYIPAGTYKLSQALRLDISNIKITGAGMWYTNLQFTSSAQGKGGISGNDAKNVEFCNMYINSNLRSRYDEKANYKCFMDVWSGGSYIHDIWEDHFECGFWIADYNPGNGVGYSDGMKIANCRIRNNFADGVNFCQGTSHATVYNCSIRNNGDDGLAMWNNDYLNVKDETNNVFCYNTIDFVWRAGAIAIYGGSGHQIYNNYIADTFMASGIHMNTVFDGYKFRNNMGITFSNNILVRSGTTSDSWNSDLAAIDISGAVRNVTFKNTYIYDAQHDAVRIIDSPSNIVFDNLSVYGTGADGKVTAGINNGALFKFAKTTSSPYLVVNGLKYANIAYSSLIYGQRTNCTITAETNLGKDYKYSIPTGTLSKVDRTTEVQAPTVTPTVPSTTQTSVKVAKTKIKKATRAKTNKKIKITLKKVKGAAGYQIRYSTSKKFKKKYTKTVNTKKNNKTIKKLKAKKKYYIQARVYKIVNGKKYYSTWTKTKTVKVKK